MRAFAALVAILVPLWGSGCQDQALKEFNEDPTAEIYSPLDGAELKEGAFFLASGQVFDDDDPIEQLLVTWILNGEVRCAEAPPMADGRTECGMSLGKDDSEISLMVVDPNEASYQASIKVISIPASGPVVHISEPSLAQYQLGQKLTFQGTVSDGEDPASALRVWWWSDLDDELDFDLALNDDGSVTGYYDGLSAGTHVLRLWAEDTSGRANSAEVIVDILPAPTPPMVEISHPVAGEVLECDAPVFFSAIVGDSATPAEELQIQWSSSLDGIFNSDAASALGTIEFDQEGLSEGEHEITLAVIDSDEMTNTAEVSFTLCSSEDTGGAGDTGEAGDTGGAGESGDTGAPSEAE